MVKQDLKLIIVDGIDGTGKTTVTKHLQTLIAEKRKDLKVFYADFPDYNTSHGKIVRDLLTGNLGGDPVKLDAITACLPYTLDRRLYYKEHEEEISMADIIIMNRSWTSNLLFQGVKYARFDMYGNYKFTSLSDFEKILLYLYHTEIEDTWLEQLPSTCEIWSWYLHHSDFTTNIRFMQKRNEDVVYGNDDHVSQDYHEKNINYLKNTHAFAMDYIANANTLSTAQTLLPIMKYFYLRPYTCSCNGTISTPHDIAEELFRQCIMLKDGQV